MVTSRSFAKWKDPTNDFLSPEYIKAKKDEFEAAKSKREQVYLKADRMALNEIKTEVWAEENNWWNRLKTMSERDIDLMPMGFIKKYGSFFNHMRDVDNMVKTDESRYYMGRWNEVKNLNKLLTNNEKDEIQAYI